jgi:15-cis-phytoene synthase
MTEVRPELEARAAEARAALESLYGSLREAGCTAPQMADGQLIRPVLSLAGAAALGLQLRPEDWSAIAAVQLAHEASLVHDDVIDSAAERRSLPTLVAARGVAAALVEGDHLLTTAYRVAAASGSSAFMGTFAHAVERTVAGEKLQGRMAGTELDEKSYRRIVGLKSGELIGCALAAVAFARNAPQAAELYVLGRRIGTLYQMLDDLLDYCPAAHTGKPPLGDYLQRRWTWPLLELPGASFDLMPDEVAELFAGDGRSPSPLRRCLQRLEGEAELVRMGLALHLPDDRAANELIASWLDRATGAVEATEAAHAETVMQESLRAYAAAAASRTEFFRVNSRSFSFAARLFPVTFRERIENLYAFCRLTDDLADGDMDAEGAAAMAERQRGEPAATFQRLSRLHAWERLARASWQGQTTGIGLLDEVMHDAAKAGVPFEYVEELIAGMRMDLEHTSYPDMAALRVYSHRVAGVVGQWMTRMCGITDPWMLQRAAALGHAMQLTNILRDVGEDVRRGRIYLPADRMTAHGVGEHPLRRALDGGPIPAGYAALLEELMSAADADYAAALEAVPRLPRWFGRAVTVAAVVYRGIHDEIRRNAYDNLHQRARTGIARKVRLALAALTAAPRLEAPPLPTRLVVTAAPAADLHDVSLRQRAAPLRRGAGAALVMILLAAPPMASAQARVTTAVAIDMRTPAAYVRQLDAEHAVRREDPAVMLDLMRALYFVGVNDAAAGRRGNALLEDLRARAPSFAADHAPLLAAYEGAFRLLEAKHGAWPPARWQAVRYGLRQLDSAVEVSPADPEIRYLRLVNTQYLPGMFGRRETARTDREILRTLLDHSAAALHPALAGVIADFVRATGS